MNHRMTPHLLTEVNDDMVAVESYLVCSAYRALWSIEKKQ